MQDIDDIILARAKALKTGDAVRVLQYNAPEVVTFTHEHESVPFHMDGSLRAAVDLKP